MQLLPPAFIFRLKRILNRHSLHLPWRFRNYGIPYFSPRENIPQDLVCVSVSFIIFKSRIDTELYTFFRYVMAYSKEKQLSCPCISPLFHLPKENTSWHVIFIYCRRFRAKKKIGKYLPWKKQTNDDNIPHPNMIFQQSSDARLRLRKQVLNKSNMFVF